MNNSTVNTQSQDEYFTCKLCRGEFNDSDKAPLILKACRHTFCKSCVEKLTDQARKVKLSFGRCPECDEQFFFSPISSDIYQDFQRNQEVYARLLPRLQAVYCKAHPKNKKLYICLNPQCPIKDRFCQDCARTHNPNCANKLTINENSFAEIVRFKSDLRPLDCFNKGSMYDMIKAEIQALETYLLSMVDSIEERFAEDQAKLDKIIKDKELFLQNKQLFTFKDSSILTELTFELKAVESYPKFAAFFADMFGMRLWSDIYKTANFDILNYFDENKFDAAQIFPEWEQVYRRSSQIHPNIRNDLLLGNWMSGRVFSFDRFFSGIRSKLGSPNPKFVDYESKLFDKGMVYFAHKAVQKAFGQQVLDSKSITNSIANDFNEEYKNGFFNFLNGNKNYTWHAALEYMPANQIKVGSKYIRMRCLKHELTIYTKE